jgi:hypothetical protein
MEGMCLGKVVAVMFQSDWVEVTFGGVFADVEQQGLPRSAWMSVMAKVDNKHFIYLYSQETCLGRRDISLLSMNAYDVRPEW